MKILCLILFAAVQFCQIVNVNKDHE